MAGLAEEVGGVEEIEGAGDAVVYQEGGGKNFIRM